MEDIKIFLLPLITIYKYIYIYIYIYCISVYTNIFNKSNNILKLESKKEIRELNPR